MRASIRLGLRFFLLTLAGAHLAAVVACSPGVVDDGSGAGGATSVSATATTGGAGGASCGGCDEPAGPTCVDAFTLRTSSSPGHCDAATCAYPSTDVACPNGCNSGECHTAMVSASFTNACALTEAGAAFCWGRDDKGQLGDGSTADSDVGVPVAGLGSGVRSIAVGADAACALTEAGEAMCWGFLPGVTAGAPPAPIAGFPAALVDLAVGSGQACAVTTDGAAMCWGFNSDGRVGDGSTTSTATPVTVSGLSSGVAGVSAGSSHSCAVKVDGTVACWGDNAHGQLGDGTTESSLVPVTVSGLPTAAVRVVAMWQRTCAIDAQGALRCWGKNAGGALGDGSTMDRPLPVLVKGLGGPVHAVAGSDSHTCALLRSGRSACWGANDFGQLGTHTTAATTTPIDVPGLRLRAIAAPDQATCAIDDAGTFECWGRNDSGQLGSGSHADSLVPVAVLGLGGES